MTTISDMERFEARLSLRHLRLVAAIASEGSLLAAAARLNMTQSAVTKALHDVEALAGVALFRRSNRGALPTPEGAALAAHAGVMLRQLHHAGQELADLRDGTGGRVVVGTLLSAAVSLLPEAIARVLRDRPRLSVRIIEGTNDTLIPMLRAGEVDFATGRLPETRPRGGIVQEVLCHDRACVVAGSAHPLAGRAGLRLADLVAARWILPRQETILRRQIDAAFRAEGLEPPLASVESVSLLANRALLRHADYLGVWPGAVAEAEARAGQLVILPVALPAAARPVGILTRADGRLSPAAAALIAGLRAAARAQGNAEGMTAETHWREIGQTV